MMYGTKYTKERQEYLGVNVLLEDEDILNPSLIIEGSDGSFMRYNIYNNGIIYTVIDESLVDMAIDQYLSQLRKEKLQKLNEQSNRTC